MRLLSFHLKRVTRFASMKKNIDSILFDDLSRVCIFIFFPRHCRSLSLAPASLMAADVLRTENRNWFFFRLHLYANVRINFYTDFHSRSHWFVSVCWMYLSHVDSPTPTKPSQWRAHSIQITLHFGHAVSCTQNNVFIKRIAMPNYCMTATMNDRTSREKNGLCKLCARRSCVAIFYLLLNGEKKVKPALPSFLIFIFVSQ